MRICVYGAASDEIDRSYIEQAGEIFRALAKKGHSLIFGGGKTGMMGAAARGFSLEGAQITGVAPRFFDKKGVLFERCTEMIFTETMRERKQYMEEHADVFLTAPGGVGTLDEFFEIFTLRSLGRHDKPVILLNLNGYFDDLIAFFDKMTKEGFLSEGIRKDLKAVSGAEELDALLRSFAGVPG